MRLIRTSPDADSLRYLIIHVVGLPPSPFPNLPLLFTEAFQAKVNTTGTRADPPALSPLLFLTEPQHWQSPALVTHFPVLQIPLLQDKISDTFLKYRYSKLWPLFLALSTESIM